MEFMFSEKGRKLVVFEGFKFYCEHKTQKGWKWRCVNRMCTAKLYLDENTTVILDSNLNHNHQPDQNLKRQMISNSVKQKAVENFSERPQKLIRKEIISAPAEYTTVINPRDIKCIRKNISRARHKVILSLSSESGEIPAASSSTEIKTDQDEEILQTQNDTGEGSEVRMDVSSFSHHSSSTVTESPATRMDLAPFQYPSLTLNDVYDLCIVGAGMFGSAAARHASANVGLKICLLGPEEPTREEMPNREIFGAHYDEGRIASTLDEDLPTEVLSKNSIKRFRELEKLSGIDFYYPVGFLWISKVNSSLSKKVTQVADTLNLPIVDLSYNDIFERRYPYIKLKDDDHPLLDDFGAGYINPRNMVAAQKLVAKSQGCDIINDVVHEVKPLLNGIHEIITESNGVIKAKRILICTGAFTNFKSFPMPQLQLTINLETAALLKITFKEARRLSAMPSIVYWRPEDKLGAYILPPILYPDGYHYLKIGHLDEEGKGNLVTSLEEVKNWYLSKGDPYKIDNLSKLLIDMLPGLKYEEITEMTCVTSHSISGLPYIDRVSSTVTVAAVGSGKGAQYSDEVGRIASILSLTGRWESELPKSHFQVMYQS